MAIELYWASGSPFAWRALLTADIGIFPLPQLILRAAWVRGHLDKILPIGRFIVDFGSAERLRNDINCVVAAGKQNRVKQRRSL